MSQLAAQLRAGRQTLLKFLLLDGVELAEQIAD
jgi:hypothetical protein